MTQDQVASEDYEPGESGVMLERETEPETGATEGPHLVLDLDDDHAVFPAHADANQYLLVKHVNSLSVPGFASTNAVTALVLDQVLPQERGRLEDYLTEHGRADGYNQKLYDALSDCWEGKTMLPLARPSN